MRIKMPAVRIAQGKDIINHNKNLNTKTTQMDY